MFDDLKQDNNQAGASSPSQPSPAPTSQNFNATAATPKPAGIDDMFGDVDPAPASSGPVGPDKPSAVQSGKIKPVSQTTMPNTAQPQMASNPVGPAPAPQKMAMPAMDQNNSMMVTDNASAGPMRKIIITVLVVALLAIVGAGVYYFFLKDKGLDFYLNKNTDTNTNQNINEDTNTDTNTNQNINEDDMDDDGDGLTNGLEKIYGTNPLEPDTDNDGVFDQDEVELYHTDPLSDDSDGDGLDDHKEIIIYKTDPNNPDTDGDTYPDGSEVGNGYNPLGNGKLVLPPPGPGALNTNENL